MLFDGKACQLICATADRRWQSVTSTRNALNSSWINYKRKLLAYWRRMQRRQKRWLSCANKVDIIISTSKRYIWVNPIIL